MLRLCSVITAFTFAIIAGSAGAEESGPQTIEEFLAHQRAHCGIIVDHLNSPIDWHIVLDVSGSYWNGRPPSETVVDLLRRLPVEEKDSLRVDFFSDRFQESGVDSDWLRSVALGDAQALELRREIDRALASAKAHIDRGATDITSSSQSLLRPHTDCATTPPRTVVLVLTDGLHDPDGSDRHTPLFTGGALPTFFSYVAIRRPRATYLRVLVDPRGIRDLAIRTTVVDDWQAGRNLLGRTFTLPSGNLFASVPAITIVNQDHQLRQALHHLARELGRTTGIFPCLCGPNLGEPWPTIDRLAPVSSEHSESTPEDRPIHLAPAVFEQPEEEIAFPFLFYARGPVDDYLQLHIRNRHKESAGFKQFRVISEFAEAGPWRIIEQYLPMPIRTETLRLHPLPWDLEVRLGLSDRAIWTSSMNAMPSAYGDDLSSLARRFWNATAIRGRRTAIAAAVSSLAAFYFLGWFATKFSLQVLLLNREGEMFPDDREILQNLKPFNRHLRLSYDPLRGVDRVPRRLGPTVTGDRNWELDVIVFFGLVYVALYFLRSAGLREFIDEDAEILHFADAQHDGVLYARPGSYWLENYKDRNEAIPPSKTSVGAAKADGPPKSRPPEDVERIWRTGLQPPTTVKADLSNVPSEVRVLVIPGLAKPWRWLSKVMIVGLSSATIGFTFQSVRNSLRLVSEGLFGKAFWCGFVAAVILLAFREVMQRQRGGWAIRAARILNNTLVLGAGFGPMLALGLSYFAIDSEDRALFFVIGGAAFVVCVAVVDRLRDRVVRWRLEHAKPITSADWMWEFVLGRWSLVT